MLGASASDKVRESRSLRAPAKAAATSQREKALKPSQPGCSARPGLKSGCRGAAATEALDEEAGVQPRSRRFRPKSRFG